MTLYEELKARGLVAQITDEEIIDLINNGKASGQEVPHLHIHVIPRFTGDGQQFGFTKQQYAEGEQARLGGKLEF